MSLPFPQVQRVVRRFPDCYLPDGGFVAGAEFGVDGAPGVPNQPWSRYPLQNYWEINPLEVGMMSYFCLRSDRMRDPQGFGSGTATPAIRFAVQLGEGDPGEPEAYGIWKVPAQGIGGRVVQIQGVGFHWVAIYAALDEDATVDQHVTWSVRLTVCKLPGAYNVNYGQFATPGK